MDKDFYLQIAKNIKKYRLLNKLTQEEMAKKLNVDYQYYAQLERGKRNFTLERIMDSCSVLHVELNDIIPDVPRSEEEDNIDRAVLIGQISQKLNEVSTKELLKIQRFINDFIEIL
ncbi:MAG: helix-turn-helix domain-containing protein [Lachnospiraceae bacterium]|nr:helix-turn-helix domain-containing protein [Lachnospiraceae bacterium]